MSENWSTDATSNVLLEKRSTVATSGSSPRSYATGNIDQTTSLYFIRRLAVLVEERVDTSNTTNAANMCGGCRYIDDPFARDRDISPSGAGFLG